MNRGIISGFVAWVLVLTATPALAAAPVLPAGGLAIEAGPPPNPWTGLAVRNEGGPVRFAVMSDRNGGNRPGIFPDAIRKLNLLQPQFVMSVGDFITGYTRDKKFMNRDWDEVQAELSKLEAPFFFTPGNHDLTNPVEVEV